MISKKSYAEQYDIMLKVYYEVRKNGFKDIIIGIKPYEYYLKNIIDKFGHARHFNRHIYETVKEYYKNKFVMADEYFNIGCVNCTNCIACIFCDNCKSCECCVDSIGCKSCVFVNSSSNSECCFNIKSKNNKKYFINDTQMDNDEFMKSALKISDVSKIKSYDYYLNYIYTHAITKHTFNTIKTCLYSIDIYYLAFYRGVPENNENYEVDDFSNIDCIKCIDCLGCVKCKSCINCLACYNSIGCAKSSYLSVCLYCVDTIYSHNSKYCLCHSLHYDTDHKKIHEEQLRARSIKQLRIYKSSFKPVLNLKFDGNVVEY